MKIAIALSVLAITLSLAAFFVAQKALGVWREKALREFGDPTKYIVVTDGEHFRVRGPFDTFYTMRFRDRKDAQDCAEQLAHWYRGASWELEKWRAV